MKTLETLSVVKWDDRDKKKEKEKEPESEEKVPEKIKQRIDLETEMSYLSNKEKDHKYRVVLQKCHENGKKWLKMTKKGQNLAF